MFTLDTKITDLNVKEKNIRKVFFSMNIHKVATPEMMLEEAKSYALFIRERKGKLSAYIALHLLSTNRRLYYYHSDNPFLDDKMEEVEEEAVAFAESLGAMLDEIDFTKLSDFEQDRWIDEQEIFSQKASPPEVHSVSQPSAQAQQAAQTVQQPSTHAQPEPQAPSGVPVSHVEQPAPATPVVELEQPAPQVQKPSLAARASTPSSPIPKTTKVQKPVLTPQTPQSQPQTSITQAAETSTKQPKQGQPLPGRQQQEIMQQAIKAGIAKPPKQTQSKETQPVSGGVRRDREALARLLTSF